MLKPRIEEIKLDIIANTEIPLPPKKYTDHH